MNPRVPSRRTATAALALTLIAAGLAGCTNPSDGRTTASHGGGGAETGGFPVTVENCGTRVTIAKRPERIVLVNNDALPNVEALGAVDRIVAITAKPAQGLFSDATVRALERLTPLTTEQNATGGAVVSQESLLGMRPDLVVAPENAVDRKALEAAGVPVYSPSAYCDDPPAEYRKAADFDRVWEELETTGRILGAQEAASTAIEAAKREVAGGNGESAGTAAALYVSSGGATLSPYGGPSMVTPVFAAAGLRNVYAASEERVFDVSVEDLVAQDPRTIVLLTSGGDPAETERAFLSAPGVSGLSAVREHRIITLEFPYTDPPSVLSARGPAELRQRLDALP